MVLKAISFEDRGPGHQYPYKFSFSMADRPFAAECDPDIRAWLDEHVGPRHSSNGCMAYVVWDYAVLFRNPDDALSFRLRWT